jgi:hypothetical protein
MIRSRLLPSLALLTVLAACQGADSTSPTRLSPIDGAAAAKGGVVPGSVGGPGLLVGNGRFKGCTPTDAQVGTAMIGPSGGELLVGTHRLIVPPGALTQTVQITGTAPSSATPTIYLEPHGLQFKKSAGLILDASNCTDVPPLVYINEIGVASAPILAIYSTLWRTVAVPIDHFSGYAVAFEEDSF